MSAPVRERCQDRAKSVAFGQAPVIQTPELGARIMRYELAYYEWTAIKPMLPNKPRGVPRVASPTGTETWYRKLVDMQQSHVVKRGSQFYFRIAVPLCLTKIKIEGKREIKASLRTSDAMSAKMRRRVLSDALELLFQVS